MVVLIDYNFLSMSLQTLFVGDFIMVPTRRAISRNICLGCYILDDGDSYSRLLSDVVRVVHFFHGILAMPLKLKLCDNELR
jgi:hypothetical protein